MDRKLGQDCKLGRGLESGQSGLNGYPLRLLAFGAFTFAAFLLVYRGVVTIGAEAMGRENGPIELAQVGFALLALIGLLIASIRTPVGRSGLFASAAVVAYAAARESDVVLERLFFEDAYKWLVGIPFFTAALFLFVSQRRVLYRETVALLSHPAATLYVVAGIYLGVCQNLDRPGFWADLGSESQLATTKALVEEYAELFAYLLLAYSGIEAMRFADAERRAVILERTDVELPNALPIAAPASRSRAA